MPFRDDLDLGGVIPHYKDALVGKSPPAPDYSNEKIPKSMYAAPLTAESTTFPKQVGNGPVFAASTMELGLYPSVIWDTNGYYSSLGVDVRATRKQMREAYLDSGGEGSVWVTYCLKQLLNADIRRAYDLTPLGEKFMDRYEQEALKRRAMREAERRGSGTPEDVLDDWGYAVDPDQDMDAAPPPPQGLDNDDDMHQPADTEIEWVFSHFLWRTGQRSPEPLAKWQTLLISALSRLGAKPPLAVGYVGNQPHPYVVGKVGNAHVVFLNTGIEPDEQVAESAARALIRELQPT